MSMAADTSIVPQATLRHPKAVAPAYAILTFHDDGSLKRRHLYLSLHSAIRAQERAEARGQRFVLMLVELVPVSTKPVLVLEGGAA
ncbi:MAG: hypothetical protein JWR85_3809 [Marmoricola sp.]|nr:hypothetical protein [Marmoricola sp.]